MIIEYSQNSTLKEALVKTFNGKHPCTLCKVVQEGKKSEKKQPLLNAEMKLDIWLVYSPSLLYPPPPFVVLPSEADSSQGRCESPPTPPPRAA